ncbi:hypothetical protein AKJ53_00960 [candidate division MSBL1 archaeon SCGC-AAA382F02]|uniref:Methyltransferase domain-containing protein n=1 Tax=candidate division MSBL1 archaeon SCGC-AAA382F02 TaxID=1698282 RepID=A0A133VIH7_9EURY|nr:hypothetical protein AKJ53_00960 [candidate division MSBL1 archaeon SCGC-AAA382F02]
MKSMEGRKEKIENRYEEAGDIEREEYEPIVNWIDPNSKVLDVGCGTGSLSVRLVKEKDCKVWGVDMVLSVSRLLQFIPMNFFGVGLPSRSCTNFFR